MKGRFLPYAAAAGIPASLPVNHDMRTKIRGRKFGDTKYEKMLLTLIALGLPKSIHEGFSLNRANIRRKCLNPPRAMVSAVGWDFIEQFKVFAAESTESASMLLGVQHGGAYGMLEYIF